MAETELRRGYAAYCNCQLYSLPLPESIKEGPFLRHAPKTEKAIPTRPLASTLL